MKQKKKSKKNSNWNAIKNVLSGLIKFAYYPFLFFYLLMTVSFIGIAILSLIKGLPEDFAEATDFLMGSALILTVLFVLTQRPLIIVFEFLLRFGYLGFPMLIAMIGAFFMVIEDHLLSLIGINVNADNEILIIVALLINSFLVSIPYYKILGKHKFYEDRHPKDTSLFTKFKDPLSIIISFFYALFITLIPFTIIFVIAKISPNGFVFPKNAEYLGIIILSLLISISINIIRIAFLLIFKRNKYLNFND